MQAQKIWTDFLWTNRVSAIEPVSYIDQQGRIDMSIKLWAQPRFFAIESAGELFAVTSFFRTSQSAFRLRGTWVSSSHRGKGLGRILLDRVLNELMIENSAKILWTMARQTAAQFYERNGFRQMSKVDGYEFGPHLIMQKDLYVPESRF